MEGLLYIGRIKEAILASHGSPDSGIASGELGISYQSRAVFAQILDVLRTVKKQRTYFLEDFFAVKSSASHLCGNEVIRWLWKPQLCN